MANVMQPHEEWRDIPGFGGFYRINKFGEIKSIERRISKITGGSQLVRERILHAAISKYGYPKVVLRRDKSSYTYLVHRLLAIVFIPNPSEKPQINHLDGNRANHSLDNLEWCTPQENMIHAKQHHSAAARGSRSTLQTHSIGKRFRNNHPSGFDDSRSKTIVQLSLAGDFVNIFGSLQIAARELKASRAGLATAVNNPEQPYRGCKWRLATPEEVANYSAKVAKNIPGLL